jgi:tRNA(Ile)-lysidine synthase
VQVVPTLVEKVAGVLRGLAAAGMVAAVSGGPDSVALLRALLSLRDAEEPGPLVMAHLNHRLRGPESDADEAFVRQLHETLQTQGARGLLFRCERFDTAALAEAEHDNLESAARELRYDWLGRVAVECGCATVVTGHTADDQAETVLHRLLRGTGLKGLRGIALRRSLRSNIALLRPMLSCTRAEVLSYLEALNQPFRHDSSNDDPRFTRNRIRHQLLPALAEQFNPGIVAVLCRLAEQADEFYGEEEQRVRQLLADAGLPAAGSLLIFRRDVLKRASRSLLREMFRFLWEREGWPASRMDFAAWDRLAAVALGEQPAVNLPGGIEVRSRERVVQVGPAQ